MVNPCSVYLKPKIMLNKFKIIVIVTYEKITNNHNFLPNELSKSVEPMWNFFEHLPREANSTMVPRDYLS